MNEFTVKEADKPMIRKFCEAVFDSIPGWKVPLYEKMKETRSGFMDQMEKAMYGSKPS